MSAVSAKRTVVTSFVVDLIDIGLNVAVMMVTGSVVLLAEALEGASDLVASGLLWIGLKTSKRRPDKLHPFGHGKALYSWTLISALVMLIFGGGLSFYFGLDRLINPEEIQHIALAYAALTISICTNGYALSVSYRRLFHKSSLKEFRKIFLHSSHVETKNTFILDLTGTSAAVFGMISLILYQVLGIHSFDGIGSMSMGLIIATSSVFLILGVKQFLAGKKAPDETESMIRDLVLEDQRIKNITELKTMFLGTEKLLVHVDISLSGQMKLNEANEIVLELKERLSRKIKTVAHVQVEFSTGS